MMQLSLVTKSKTSFQLLCIFRNIKFMTLEPFSYDFWAFKFSFAALTRAFIKNTPILGV